MIRVLVMDDSPERIPTFIKLFDETGKKYKMYVATSVKEAISVLKAKSIDMMFLDHDLGENQPDGRDFCNRVARELPVEKVPQRILIHSHNPVGALEMQNVLQNKFGDHIISLTRSPFREA